MHKIPSTPIIIEWISQPKYADSYIHRLRYLAAPTSHLSTIHLVFVVSSCTIGNVHFRISEDSWIWGKNAHPLKRWNPNSQRRCHHAMLDQRYLAIAIVRMRQHLEWRGLRIDRWLTRRICMHSRTIHNLSHTIEHGLFFHDIRIPMTMVIVLAKCHPCRWRDIVAGCDWAKIAWYCRILRVLRSRIRIPTVFRQRHISLEQILCSQ